MSLEQELPSQIDLPTEQFNVPTDGRRHLLELSPAEISYFEQTRKECDTEKTQKDKILQYAFLVAGGTSVYGLTNLDQKTPLSSWTAVIISLSILILLIALMNWRRQKFRAQGYRMVVLYGLIKTGIRRESNWISVESIIIKGLKKNVHGRDDLLFLIGFTLPIESITLWHSYKLLFIHFDYLALIPTVISICLFVWAIKKHTKSLYREFGIGDIIEEIDNNHQRNDI